MRQPALRGGHANRFGRRVCTVLASVVALAILFLVLRGTASSGRTHPILRDGDTSRSILLPDAAESQRQLASIDWKSCLAPREEDIPMTKEQFLQQKPARCSALHGIYSVPRPMPPLQLNSAGTVRTPLAQPSCSDKAYRDESYCRACRDEQKSESHTI